MTLPRLLIEEWLPCAAIGAECRRERATGQQPPTARLHVWWARRPLTASRAAVLASLLPADFDRQRFGQLLGFHKSAERVVEAARILDEARRVGRHVDNPHGSRAFRSTPAPETVEDLHRDLVDFWGELPTVLDPMAGGGSIPFEAMRLRLPVLVNEYNPVAGVILQATLELSRRFGARLLERADYWKEELLRRVIPEIRDLYDAGETPDWCYLWARTVRATDDEPPSPLVPSWWLTKNDGGKRGLAGEPYPTDGDHGAWSIRIKTVGPGRGTDLRTPPAPTIRRGQGKSMYSAHRDIPPERIKSEARAGRMGEELYCVSHKCPHLSFRPATDADRAAYARACARLEDTRDEWEHDGILPTEARRDGDADRILAYGMGTWQSLFNPRQLYSLGVVVRELCRLGADIEASDGPELAAGVETLLSFGVDKAADRNSRLSRWVPQSGIVANTFDRHNYATKWCYAEMALASAGGGLRWCLENALDAYKGLCELMPADTPAPVLCLGSATSLAAIEQGSVAAVVMDPPYDDNVQYSELADYFYVWMKRTVGHRFEGYFDTQLCDDTQEAVVDITRFGGQATRRGQAEALARERYRRLMLLSFQEARRVLRDNGCLTVMFTHKKQEAWGALFDSLVQAGFQITASWPVRTEFEHSLHIARKNAAESTVLLACRKRTGGEEALWEDVRPELQEAAVKTAERLAAEGMNRVDQLVGSFGPAMSVFSRHARVDDGGEDVPSARAIEAAAEAVVDWRLRELQERSRNGHDGLDVRQLDAAGRFWLLWWDVLAAHEARFNEVMLLCRSLGVDVGGLEAAGLLKKSGDNVTLLGAKERRAAEARREPQAESGVLFEVPAAPGRRRAGTSSKIHPSDPDHATLMDLLHAWALAYLEAGAGGLAAGSMFARRHHITPQSPSVRLAQALLRVAPAGVWYGARQDQPNDIHPEFFAWRELLQAAMNVPVPEWKVEEPVVTQPALDLVFRREDEPEEGAGEEAEGDE